jgi:predicted permease
MALRRAGDYRRANQTLESMAGYFPGTRVLTGSSGPERIGIVFAERSIFHVLGADAAAGRTFREDDPSGTAVASAEFVRRRFATAPAAIGQIVVTENDRFTIVGVMPESFRLPYSTTRLQGTLAGAPTSLWAVVDPPENPRSAMDVTIGRLEPGVDRTAAQADLAAIAKRLAAEFPETSAGIGVELTPLADTIVGSVRTRLLLLLGAVGLVLLAACSNVANLLLVRGSTRARETAIRIAVGASRNRLIRQLLTESLVLSLAGGILGFALALWGTPVVVAFAGSLIPRASDITLDWRVLTFLLLVATTMGQMLGAAPALAASTIDVSSGLSRGSEFGSGSIRLGRLRDALAAAEIALAFVLVISAGLLTREAVRLANTETGLAPDSVLTMHVTPNLNAQACADLVRQIETLPGVRAAAFAQMLPLQSWGWTATFSIVGRDPFPPAERPVVELRYVTPGYFTALGIPIRRGRAFTDADTAQAPRVIIVNDALARRYFGDEDPVGRQTDRGTIVGVAGDVRQAGLDRSALPDIYYPVAQNMSQLNDLGMTLIVSGEVPPATLAGPARDLIRRSRPDLAVFEVRTMGEVVAQSLAESRLYTWFVGLFAALILVLACAGIYGVLSSVVTSRTREFGIRLALGAGRSGLQWLVLRHAATLLGAGLAVGLVGAVASARVLDSVIVGASRVQPLPVAAAAAILASVAMLACLVPVRRAAGIDPIATLRQD